MIPPPPKSTLFPYTTLFRSLEIARDQRYGTDERHRLDIFRSGKPRNAAVRSEEHTSELQSHVKIVCRLLLEKKKLEDEDGALRVKAADAGLSSMIRRVTLGR